MNIVACSDLHRDIRPARALVAASAGADVAVCAGDLGDRGRGAGEVLGVLAARSPHVHLLHGTRITTSVRP